MGSSPLRRRPRPEGDPEAAAVAVTSLDSLPEEMLQSIVSRLPVRDAVRTSALSRSWNRRWETTPDLCLFWSRRPPVAAISAVLACYSCSICHFGCLDIREEEASHTDEWIPVLAAKGVKSLTLSFLEENDEFHSIHPAIFTCGDLTNLHLEGCLLPSMPEGFTGFPNLTTLSLAYVSLPENGMKELEAMIRMSLSLESLELDNIMFSDDDDSVYWIIEAPNLKRLTILASIDDGWEIQELPSIQEANINIDDYFPGRDFVKLLTCLSQVIDLEFVMPTTGVDALKGLSCSFQKLRSLTLHTGFNQKSSILSTFSLLNRTPSLKHLEIEITNLEYQHYEVDLDFFSALWTNSLFANLDFVSMKSATFWPNEMHFIKFVLSNARVLRELYVYHDNPVTYSKSREDMLLKYKRASPKAKLFIKDMKDFWSNS